MCWSGPASATLAAFGFAGAAYCYRKGEAPTLCVTLAYFSGMEALQAYTYAVINDCGNPRNQVATLLGYLHIAFQPFFINAVSMHFIPREVRRSIQPVVYGLCFVAAWLIILRLYPFTWAPPCYDMHYIVPLCGSCRFNIPFCGKEICSVSGSWHIAWQLPAHYNIISDNAYLAAAFILPLIYGSWRMTLYHLLTGPFLAFLTTSNPNEWVAVWCLYSIGLLGLMVKSPVRKFLYVRRWIGWKLLAPQ